MKARLDQVMSASNLRHGFSQIHVRPSIRERDVCHVCLVNQLRSLRFPAEALAGKCPHCRRLDGQGSKGASFRPGEKFP